MRPLVVFPLVILIGVALLTQMGVGTFTFGDTSYTDPEGLYDANGHLAAYVNGSAADEAGTLEHRWNPNGGEDWWHNGTAAYYQIWNTPNASNSEFNMLGFSMGTSLGIIGLVVAVIALAAVVGLKIVGSGIGEFSSRTIVIATGFITLWGLFSILAIGGITSIPIIGTIFYFVLTGAYSIGVLDAVGGGE